MSKAFVKDDVDSDPASEIDPLESLLQMEGKIYVTPEGMRTCHLELEELQQRPDGGGKRRSSLEKLIQKMEVVDPALQSGERARFGARVKVRDESGEVRRYQIVGLTETDSKQHRVSYISPIGKALLGARAGDVVLVNAPHGEEEMEILSVEYESES